MSDGSDLLGHNDIAYPQRVGNLYTTATLTSANGTTPITLFTGNPGYYIAELGMQLTPDITIAVAGTVQLSFVDSSFGVFFRLVWFIPATAPTKTQATISREVSGPNFYWSGKVPSTTVTVTTDTALTGGSVRFFARYGLTSHFG